MKMSNFMVQRCNVHKQAFQRAQPSCATKRSNARPSVPTCDRAFQCANERSIFQRATECSNMRPKAFQRAQQILSPTCYKCLQAARLVARLYPQGSCAAVQLPLSSRKRASPRTRQRCLCKKCSLFGRLKRGEMLAGHVDLHAASLALARDAS